MIEFVSMQEKHVPTVAELERDTFSMPWSEDSIRGELHNPLSDWLVAAVDDVPLGYIGAQTVGEEADILNMAVTKFSRRNGIGLALMEKMLARLRQKGVKTVTLEVRESNEGAIALYECCGFRTVAIRPNYYSKPKENALIMRKELI